MADHDRIFGSNLPVVTDIAGQWTSEADNLKDDISQRLTLDHYMDGVLTEGAADQDGRHRQVTMKGLASAPTHIADTGILYTKDVDGITELHYKDDTGQETQITDDGEVFQNDFSKDLNDIFSNAASVTGTAGTAASQSAYAEVTISYPSGYTKSNSIVLNSKIVDTSSQTRECANFNYYVWSGVSYYYGVEILFLDAGIKVRTTREYNGGDINIILGKLN